MIRPRYGEEFVDQLLTSIKIVGMIKEGQKVCIRNGLLTLETKSTGVGAALRRWIHNDNRYSTLMYIRNVVNNSVDVCNIYPRTDSVIIKITESLESCLTGLGCLIVTYGDDAGITATIGVMQDRIRAHIINMSVNKDIKPCRD